MLIGPWVYLEKDGVKKLAFKQGYTILDARNEHLHLSPVGRRRKQRAAPNIALGNTCDPPVLIQKETVLVVEAVHGEQLCCRSLHFRHLDEKNTMSYKSYGLPGTPRKRTRPPATRLRVFDPELKWANMPIRSTGPSSRGNLESRAHRSVERYDSAHLISNRHF